MPRTGFTALVFVLISAFHLTSAQGGDSEVVVADPCPSGSRWVVQSDPLARGCFNEKKQIRLGRWEWFDSQNRIRIVLSFDERGREEGDLIRFSQTGGQIVERTHYKAGLLDGPSSEWWPESGHIKDQKFFVEGRLHGTRKRWAYQPSPERRSCLTDDESCWVGRQECWNNGERLSNDECAEKLSAQSRKSGRAIAGSQ